MQKEKTFKEKKIGYLIFKPIIKGLFKLYFNPKVIGLDNIPKTESFILCGNHTNVHDQFPIMINTKRIIHYMAKKEYFDSKMGWFFRLVGQISVNREIKDIDAKSEAVSILENNGALGIFPEGTRNRLQYKKDIISKIINENKINISEQEYIKIINQKEFKLSQIKYLKELFKDKIITYKFYQESLLDPDKYLKKLLKSNKITESEYINSLFLPFKFGAVSLASKTNSYILPFAVSGHYKFRSKDLVIKIGIPFKVTSDLEKSNKLLTECISELLISK